jgi:hypothetical protein
MRRFALESRRLSSWRTSFAKEIAEPKREIIQEKTAEHASSVLNEK